MNNEKRLAIVVLNYNGNKFVDLLYSTINQQSYNKFDLIILDNASTDNSLDTIKKIVKNGKIIEFKRNIGYAGAFNYAASHLHYDYLLFLNNDLSLDKNCVEELMKLNKKYPCCIIINSKIMCWENRNIIDSAGGKLTYVGGAYLIGNGETDIQRINKIIGTAHGASMLVNRNLFLKIGGFDPDFFMYHEEVDLCWRSWLYNYPIIYASSSIVYHYGGYNWDKNPKYFKEFHKTKNRYVCVIKNCQTKYLIIFLSLKTRSIIYMRALLGAYFYIVKNSGRIIRKRRLIQRNRKNSFPKLRKKGIFASFLEHVERFIR